MTECEKCKRSFEETEMHLIQEDKIKFLCNTCKDLNFKNKTQVIPQPIKPHINDWRRTTTTRWRYLAK